MYDHNGDRVVKREYGKDGKLDGETLYLGSAEVRAGKLIRWVHAAGKRIAEAPRDMPKEGFPDLPVPLFVVAGLTIHRGRNALRSQPQSVRRLRGWLTAMILCLVAVGGSNCGGGCRSDGAYPLVPDKDTRWR